LQRVHGEVARAISIGWVCDKVGAALAIKDLQRRGYHSN
jgi:hypothetical protein